MSALYRSPSQPKKNGFPRESGVGAVALREPEFNNFTVKYVVAVLVQVATRPNIHTIGGKYIEASKPYEFIGFSIIMFKNHTKTYGVLA